MLLLQLVLLLQVFIFICEQKCLLQIIKFSCTSLGFFIQPFV